MAVVDGDILQMVVDFAGYGGDHYQNKFTWEYQGTTYPDSAVVAGLVSWAEDFYELMDTEMMALVTGFLLYVDVIEWDVGESIWVVVRNVGLGTGALTLLDVGDGLPPQAAPCLIGVTERPKSRGRKSIPFFGEDTQDQGQWETVAFTALAAALAQYIAGYVIATGHSVAPGVASTVTGTFLPFVASILTDVVFSQIRRTRGRGG